MFRTDVPPAAPGQPPAGRHLIHSSGGPRVAPQHPPERQHCSGQWAVPAQGPERVGRTTRVVPAPRSKPRRNDQLIPAHQCGQRPGKRIARDAFCRHRTARRPSAEGESVPLRRKSFCSARRQQWRRSARRSAKVEPAAAGSARTTTDAESGSSGRSSAIAARSRRFTRLRCTAPPTALDTTKPTRADPARVDAVDKCTTTRRVLLRAPEEIAAPNSSPWRIRN